MASFSKMSFFPVGYFRAFSSWLLRERRDIGARIAVLNAEIERIGFISVLYRKVERSDGSYDVTEERMGVTVTPDSTLEKLCQAYIANGGNLFDISPFCMPDRVQMVAMSEDGVPSYGSLYPHGGVVAPRSVEANNPQAYTGYEGGFLETGRYYPARLGGRTSPSDLSIAKAMRQMRDWANQAIKEKLLELEWRIVKQMDLREQLTVERDETLMQAFGGSLASLPVLDQERFSTGLTTPSLINDMYELLFEMEGPEQVRAFRAGSKVGFLDFTFGDEGSEIRDPLGG